MINLFGPLRHTNLWSVAAFDKDGDGGGGGGDDGGSDGGGTRSEADIQKDINNALAESGGQWTSELNDLVAERDVARGGGGAPADTDSTFDFQGPMPDGTAGYTQDVSETSYDPFTGFLTDDDDDDNQFQGPTFTGPGYTQDVSTIGVDPNTGFLTGDDDDNDFGMTPATPLDTSVGIENLLPPPAPQAPAVAVDEFSGLPPEMTDPTFTYASPAASEPTYQGPTFTGPGYTQDVSQMDVDEDTGFITEDQGVDYTPPPPPPPRLSRSTSSAACRRR
jgi:hypothetical protein